MENKLNGLNLTNSITNGDFSDGIGSWDKSSIIVEGVMNPSTTLMTLPNDEGVCYGNTNGTDWKIVINIEGEKWFLWNYTGINLTEKGLEKKEPSELARIILGGYYNNLRPNIIKAPVTNCNKIKLTKCTEVDLKSFKESNGIFDKNIGV